MVIVVTDQEDYIGRRIATFEAWAATYAPKAYEHQA